MQHSLQTNKLTSTKIWICVFSYFPIYSKINKQIIIIDHSFQPGSSSSSGFLSEAYFSKQAGYEPEQRLNKNLIRQCCFKYISLVTLTTLPNTVFLTAWWRWPSHELYRSLECGSLPPSLLQTLFFRNWIKYNREISLWKCPSRHNNRISVAAKTSYF